MRNDPPTAARHEGATLIDPLGWLLRRPAQTVSTYRTEAMGLAILLVVMHHVALTPASSSFAWVLPIKDLGYLGVDAFFFFSGFGLMCGHLRRPCGSGAYIRRRLLRILPGYLLVSAVLLVLQGLVSGPPPLTQILATLTLTNYLLLANPQFWFVPAILCCYAAFPAYARLFVSVRRKDRLTGAAVLLGILAGVGLSLLPGATHLLVFVFRLPAFFLGIHAGWAHVTGRGRTASNGEILGILGISLGGFALLRVWLPEAWFWRLGLWWLPFVACGPALGHVLAAAGRVLSHRLLWPLGALLRLCGHYSYEIYLLHVALFDLFAGSGPILPVVRKLGWPDTHGLLLHLLLLAMALWLAPKLQKPRAPQLFSLRLADHTRG